VRDRQEIRDLQTDNPVAGLFRVHLAAMGVHFSSRARLGAALVCGALLFPESAARAEARALTAEEVLADQVTSLRVDHLEGREAAGVALMSGGLVSVVGGGATAIGGHSDPFWLWFGVGHAVWGSVNAVLAFGLLDLSGTRRAAIEAERALRGDALAKAREEALRAQHAAATLYALNLGLDVAYISAGVLMFVAAELLDDQSDRDALRGYSLAMTAQGGFLLAFDLIELLLSLGRADDVAVLPIP
jgi:hypothetical protein